MNKKQLLATVALTAVTALANASTVFDNGTASLGQSGNETTAWLQANDFTLNTSANVTGATVYVGTFGHSLSNQSIQYSFYSDVNGAPGSVLESGTANATMTDTHINWIGGDLFAVSFATDAFAATAGQTYFLGFHMGSNYDGEGLYWATTTAPINDYGVESYGGTLDNWSVNGQYHAFSLSAVPEPTNALLLMMGLAGVVAATKRRNRQA